MKLRDKKGLKRPKYFNQLSGNDKRVRAINEATWTSISLPHGVPTRKEMLDHSKCLLWRLLEEGWDVVKPKEPR